MISARHLKLPIITAIYITILTLAAMPTQAQEFKDGKLWLNEDGTNYFKATLLSQVWVRNTDMNPGTTINGFAKDNFTDIGIRRMRIQAYGQITDRVFLYTQVGMNNFNYSSDRKAGFFVHDVLGEYQLSEKHLAMGAGLTAWNGLSRFSSPSVGSIMGLDAPLFQQNTNDVTDQFLRKLSVYAKGKLGKLDYRLVMSSPMSITKSAGYTPTLTNHSSFSPMPAKMQWHGYFQWQFLDQEANTTPYNTGTYLGAKKVLNIGAGFQLQPDAQWHLNTGNDTVQTTMRNFAVDLFYDAPINEKGAAVSLYAVWMNTYYGPGYTRNQATMNPANGTNDATILNGSGNGYPSFGTGNLWYTQLGYKLNNNLVSSTTFMPYITAQYAHYDRLNDNMLYWTAGVNWLLHKHTSKLTLEYQNRPVYTTAAGSAKANLTGHKSAVVLQYQVYLH